MSYVCVWERERHKHRKRHRREPKREREREKTNGVQCKTLIFSQSFPEDLHIAIVWEYWSNCLTFKSILSRFLSLKPPSHIIMKNEMSALLVMFLKWNWLKSASKDCQRLC
jgi:hypothetical protein